MSEENTAPVEQNVTPAANVETTNTNSVSYDSHRKLLGEKKAIQSELQELRAADELRKQEKLQSEGKQNEVITALREQINSIQTENKTIVNKVKFEKFEKQCADVAKDLGCVDTELMMKLMDTEKMASIQIDDKLNANKDDLVRVISEIKDHKPVIFGGNTINHTPMNLGGFKTATPKSIDQMTQSEKIEALENL